MNRARRLNSFIIFPVFLSSALLSADGRGQAPKTAKIAFTSFRDGNSEIYVMDADGKNPRNLTNHPGIDDSPAWSPNGRRIAFYSSRPDGRQIAFTSTRVGVGIYVMNSDGSNQRRLTPVHTGNLYPDWSPDGKKIAFESSRNNRKADIYVINADGTNRR